MSPLARLINLLYGVRVIRRYFCTVHWPHQIFALHTVIINFLHCTLPSADFCTVYCYHQIFALCTNLCQVILHYTVTATGYFCTIHCHHHSLFWGVDRVLNKCWNIMISTFTNLILFVKMYINTSFKK